MCWLLAPLFAYRTLKGGQIWVDKWRCWTGCHGNGFVTDELRCWLWDLRVEYQSFWRLKVMRNTVKLGMKATMMKELIMGRRTSREWLTDWPRVERRLHPGLKGLQGALPELHSVRFYSLCCFSDVIPWKSRGWSERWSSCLLRFSKGCFLKHVVSCYCFGAFVVEIEKRWWILFLAATLIILQCLCEFRITQVFTLQTGIQRPRQI